MKVERLCLKNYRNIDLVDIEFSPYVNILYGDNAQGKTNILESLFMCATGRSQRTRNDKELIQFNNQSAHISCYVSKENYQDKIDIHLKNGEKKGIAVNSIPIRRLGDLFGTINIVLFSPEDLMLVKEGPALRRRYMDIELCQLSKVYYFNLQKYYKILKERNTLLKKMAKNGSLLEDTLDVWDKQLCAYGTKLAEERKSFIEDLNLKAEKIHGDISANKESLKIEYKESVDYSNFYEKMVKNRDKDIFYGNTCVGIHKDDMVFYINGNNARDYASQGQQRTICLSLKMAEVELINEKTGAYPVLLLDDVLSELDKNRQDYILKSINNIQTIITCTGLDEITRNIGDKIKIFRVKEGKIL